LLLQHNLTLQGFFLVIFGYYVMQKPIQKAAIYLFFCQIMTTFAAFFNRYGL